MINVLLEIKRKIEDFKLQTGISPNVIYVNYSTRNRIDGILRNHIRLVESYPEIFQLPIRVVSRESRFSVGVVI